MQVRVSTGSEISIKKDSYDYLTIEIAPSALDQGQLGGLCGRFDGQQQNDLTFPDGRVTLTDTNSFLEAWR